MGMAEHLSSACACRATDYEGLLRVTWRKKHAINRGEAVMLMFCYTWTHRIWTGQDLVICGDASRYVCYWIFRMRDESKAELQPKARKWRTVFSRFVFLVVLQRRQGWFFALTTALIGVQFTLNWLLFWMHCLVSRSYVEKMAFEFSKGDANASVHRFNTTHMKWWRLTNLPLAVESFAVFVTSCLSRSSVGDAADFLGTRSKDVWKIFSMRQGHCVWWHSQSSISFLGKP